jgi:serine/threonine protein kinase
MIEIRVPMFMISLLSVSGNNDISYALRYVDLVMSAPSPRRLSAPAFSTPPAVGDVLGEHYRLKAVLGAGAMGRVFVADNVAIGVQVAIKVLRAELVADRAFRERFVQEAKAVASIQHPNVARFFDIQLGDPTFLVMEYVRGPTLEEILRAQGKLEPLRAMLLATRLAWGLHAAHTAGVVHRDLKPSNIMIAADDEVGEQPKLIDFGLARIAALPPQERLSRAGQILGTPEYMSPEQIAGVEIDGRADVYSLGCVLYRMLTGRPPFPHDGDDVKVLYSHVKNPVVPPSQLNPEVPAALEAVVMRALAKLPADRFSSMKEMAKALPRTIEKRRAASSQVGSGPLRRPGPPRVLFPLGALLVVLAIAWASVRLHGGRAQGGSLLVITTQPPGATVLLDGKPLPEATPTAQRGLNPGGHTVTLRKPGRAEVERQVTLEADERLSVDVALPAAQHPLEVRTMPPGAVVYLDGILMAGRTPAMLTVTDDEFHELRLELPGYEPVVAALKPENRTDKLAYTLVAEKHGRGTLLVEANGPAEVWIDGSSSGFVTPTVGILLSEGEHSVSLHTPSGEGGQPRKVTLRRGETVRLTLPMPSGAR